jgi:hypothetical protein
MPRAMPALSSAFSRKAAELEALTEAGERALVSARPPSPLHGHFTTRTLDALYEAAYMRLFVAWEVLLEEVFIRMLCRYESPVYVPVLTGPRCGSLADARVRMLSGRSFILWWNPTVVAARARAHLTDSPHERVLLSNLSRLQAFAAIRHRLTHGSEDARQQFSDATMLLTGRRYRGASPALFLRDMDPRGVGPLRWFATIESELVALSGQLAP